MTLQDKANKQLSIVAEESFMWALTYSLRQGQLGFPPSEPLLHPLSRPYRTSYKTFLELLQNFYGTRLWARWAFGKWHKSSHWCPSWSHGHTPSGWSRLAKQRRKHRSSTAGMNTRYPISHNLHLGLLAGLILACIGSFAISRIRELRNLPELSVIIATATLNFLSIT